MNTEQLAKFNETKDWQGGITYMLSLGELDDEGKEALGWFYSRNQQLDEALEVYKALLDEHPDSAKYLYMVGYQYYYRGDFLECTHYFEESLQKYPDYFKAKQRLLYAYSKLKRNNSFDDPWFSKAIKLAEDAHNQWRGSFSEKEKLENRSTYSKICFTHGKLIEGFANYKDKIIALFQQAVEYDQTDVNKHYHLAKIYAKDGQWQRAEQALIYELSKPYIRKLACEIACRLQNFSQFQATYSDRDLDDKFNTANYFESIVTMFINCKNYEKAYGCAQKAVNRYPDSEKCQKLLDDVQKAAKEAGIDLEKSSSVIGTGKIVEPAFGKTQSRGENPYRKKKISESATIVHGIIYKYFNDKGYGFVAEDGTNNTYFFHVSNVPYGYLPQIGDQVTFEVGIAPNGRTAAFNIQHKNPVQS